MMIRNLIRDSRIKRSLLEALRNRRVVSGDKIARELGVSRVAVWKHVKELKELGYKIDATPKGYRLLEEPHKPYPWELDVKSYYLVETDSTMNVARKLAERGEKSWTFVIAGKQSAGRGRLMRKWISREGGLYFSVILRPKLRLAKAGELLSPALSAIIKTLGEYGVKGKAVENGVYVEGKKISGVLIEVAGELDMVRYAVLGVGLNVANPVPKNATSLVLELDEAPTLLDVSQRLFNNLGTFLREV